jgi:hypothetical protein
MVVNDARETSLERMEARELELRWRREEELAALVDGELTPMPLWERFLKRAKGE